VWLAALVTGAALFAVRSHDPISAVELKTLDLRFHYLARPEKPGTPIVLVAIDQASLDLLEKDTVYWPWPRGVYEALTRYLKAAGAKGVVFDLLYTSPSSFGPADDASFAASMKELPSVLAVETSAKKQELRLAPPPERFALKTEGRVGPEAPERSSVRLPVASLMDASALVGDTSTLPDPDGVVRRVPLLFKMGGRVYPALSAAAVLSMVGDRTVSAGPDGFRLGGHRVPLDASGSMIVNYHGSALRPELGRSFEAYSAKNLIESWNDIQAGKKPQLDPTLFKEKLVFVAGSAPGILDNRPSPISAVYAGTEIVATAAANILNDDHLVPVRKRWAFLLILFAAFAGAAAVRLFGGSAGPAAGLVSAALAAGAALAFRHGLWLDVVAPQLSLWLSFAVTAAYSYATEGRQKKYIQAAFAQYLSPDVVKQIADEPSKLSLGGERREATFYFSDIEGFTTISESLEPDRLTYLMNRFLGEMTDTILESGGTLDKYIGDAVMAFWNAPAPLPDHALVACKVAIKNQEKLARLSAELQKEGFSAVRSRIGLNTGPASIGNMGSSRRFSYTALGDTVNLASRLEGANKAYHSYILISETTREGAGSAIEVRELDFVKVKGKNKPIRVFELLGLKGQTDPKLVERSQAFEAALQAYRERRFDEASGMFRAVGTKFGPDGASDTYIERCRFWTGSPPAEDWDGSFALTEK
jgi:adenylate cyclase